VQFVLVGNLGLDHTVHWHSEAAPHFIKPTVQCVDNGCPAALLFLIPLEGILVDKII
jgi:hypothetical protein